MEARQIIICIEKFPPFMKGSKYFPLTVEERLLLHLKDFPLHGNEFEAPPEVTQKGIADSIHIQRKHVPRAVSYLLSRNLIQERKCHVKGSRQRMKVYFLTMEGREEAGRIWQSVKDVPVILPEEEKQNRMSLEEAQKKLKLPPVTIITNTDDRGVVNLDNLKKEGNEKEKKTVYPREAAEDIYKIALKRAWFDGNVTFDEFAILKDLREKLGISDEVHNRIEGEVIKEITSSTPLSDTHKVYSVAVERALFDGIITEDEEAILQELQKVLGISEEEAARIKSEIKDKIMGMSAHSTIVDKCKVYMDVLEEALADGIITQDEEALLQRLRKLLDISDTEHLKLEFQVRKKRMSK